MNITAAISDYIKSLHNKPTTNTKRTLKAKRARFRNQKTVDEFKDKK